MSISKTKSYQAMLSVSNYAIIIWNNLSFAVIATITLALELQFCFIFLFFFQGKGECLDILPPTLLPIIYHLCITPRMTTYAMLSGSERF